MPTEAWLDLQKRGENEKWVPPQFIFFDILLLRTELAPYLKFEGSGWNQERAFDDFIVLVSLLGNDFLPGLPLPDFEIHLNAIDTIVNIWKLVVTYKEGFLVKEGEIRLDRLRDLFRGLSDLEVWSDQRECAVMLV